MIIADTCRNKLVMPEHLLLAALGDKVVCDVLDSSVLDCPLDEVKTQLRDYIDRQEHFDEEETDRQLFASHQYGELMHYMGKSSEEASLEVVDIPQFFESLLQLLTVIAGRCGFPNLSHFSKAFKQQFGVSPQQYRKGMDDIAMALPKSNS